MRLLHTSDWHLGRGLHGIDLHDAQRHMLSQIVSSVGTHGVDAVLIAGDVFDRAVPPVASVRLWAEALRELSSLVPVVVIPGNHDSAIRLGVGAELFREGVHIVADPGQVGTPVELRDAHGSVLVYPIPFLDPDMTRRTLGADGEVLERSHDAVMSAAMGRVRDDLARRRDAGRDARSVVMAHAFVTTGAEATASGAVERSDSERDLRVGGVDSVPRAVFSGVDYVALGHLHGAQRVQGEHIRYCGSPLRYSFSEVHQTKQLLLIDLDSGGLAGVTSIPLQQPRAMASIEGTLDELLTSDAFEQYTGAWVQVSVTDAARPRELRSRVHERFPEALVVRHVPASGPLVERVTGPGHVPTSPSEVAESFVRYVTGGDISPAELVAFESAYERALAAGRSA
jgi:exonuclease SbcD